MKKAALRFVGSRGLVAYRIRKEIAGNGNGSITLLHSCPSTMRSARRKRIRRAIAMRIVFILLIAMALVLFSASNAR